MDPMERIETINQTAQFKVLGDDRRLQILRYLMAAPATLSQLGEKLGEHPAKIRYHLKRLEQAGLVVLTGTNAVRGFVEKYYRASAWAYQVHAAILPYSDRPSQVVITGSHDMALEMLADLMNQSSEDSAVYTLPIGSMDGLIALRQGLGQIAGIHLLDPESGEYNTPFVKHLLPDKKFHLFTLAHRQQGLIVAEGNPLGLQDITSLLQDDVRFVNRRKGSGTRIWLDNQLAKENILPELVEGYTWEVNTHLQVAEAIQQNKADVGIGLQAAALAFGLGFVPLFEERFDLVVINDGISNALLAPALEFLQTARFKKAVANLGGYNTHKMGAEIKI